MGTRQNDEFSVDLIWIKLIFHGISMGFSWILMGFLWDFEGLSMGFSWDFGFISGIPMGGGCWRYFLAATG